MTNIFIIPDFIRNILLFCTDINGNLATGKILKFKNDINFQNWLNDNDITQKEAFYILKHNLTSLPTCKHCGKRIKNFNKGNHIYCSIKCAHLSEEVQNKTKQTIIEKYGVENISQSNEIKEKVKQTNLKKFGVEYPLQSNNILEKAQQTCIEKYGIMHPLQYEKFKEKAQQTCIKRYGVDNYTKTNEYIEKTHKTCQEKYGEGVLNPFQAEQIKEKIKQTCIERYGVDNIFKICYKNFYSIEEKEVLDWIKSIYSGKIIENDREILNGKELDIYIPEKKIAIEFNGDYWHSISKKDKYYHQEKSLKCIKNNIRLFHIYEYEWNNDKENIKKLLKDLLLNPNKEITFFINNEEYVDLNKGYTQKKILEIYEPKETTSPDNLIIYDAGYAKIK